MGDVRNDEPILGPGSQTQRRTLWIMAAAGLFLLVVIGAAVVLYSPAVNKEREGKAVASEYNPDDGWNDDAIKTVDDASLSDGSSVSEIPDSPFEPSLDAAKDTSSDVYSFDLEDMKPFDSSSASSSVATTDPKLADSVFASDMEDDQNTIDLNKISSSTSSVSAKNEFTAAQLESAKSASADSSRSSSSSASAKKSSSSSSSSAKVASSSKTSASSASSSASVKHAYWIQVGSFSDKSKADSARENLESKGYRNVSNSTTKEDMYRVRIGPYAAKSEAENVLVKVVKIKGYENAYVVDANAPKQK
ncbi:MAG: SPOR domain-containing protein [Treponema sp.]|nr:SPOR domain-containing protein [Treponema sp.]